MPSKIQRTKQCHSLRIEYAGQGVNSFPIEPSDLLHGWHRDFEISDKSTLEQLSSMTDAGLLRTAANRSSFVDIAQKVLADELKKRNLTVPPGELSSAIMSQTLTPVGWAQRTLVSIKSALLRLRMKLASQK